MGIEEAVLPSTLVRLRGSVFNGCAKLTTINFPDALELIGTTCFSSCSKLLSVSFGFGSGAQLELSSSVFMACGSLHTAIIGDRVIALPYQCFSDCRELKNLTLPNTLTTLGNSCLASTGLSEFDNLNIETMGNGVFASSLKLVRVNVPNVKKIGNTCFNNCPLLESINIGEYVTELPANFLVTNYLIKQYVVPPLVEKTGSYCFTSVNGLVYLELPAPLNSVTAPLLSNCTKVEALVMRAVVPPTVPQSSMALFVGHNASLLKIYVPDESLDAYKVASGWSAFSSLIKPMSEFVMPVIP